MRKRSPPRDRGARSSNNGGYENVPEMRSPGALPASARSCSQANTLCEATGGGFV